MLGTSLHASDLVAASRMLLLPWLLTFLLSARESLPEIPCWWDGTSLTLLLCWWGVGLSIIVLHLLSTKALISFMTGCFEVLAVSDH